MTKITNEDFERVALLKVVSDGDMKRLDYGQLRRLQELVEKKDYSHSGKAERSKKKLLKKINIRIYEVTEGRDI